MSDLNIKIYSDGANVDDMILADKNNSVDGFTTNPTLMAKAGITDYLGFAKEVLSQINEKSYRKRNEHSLSFLNWCLMDLASVLESKNLTIGVRSGPCFHIMGPGGCQGASRTLPRRTQDPPKSDFGFHLELNSHFAFI